MKVIYVMTFISILCMGCSETATKTETIDNSGGQVLTGPNAGATYTFACDAVGQLAIDFSDAFIRKDLDFISTEHFTDSIFFYPEKGLEKIVMDLETGKTLIQAMHALTIPLPEWSMM